MRTGPDTIQIDPISHRVIGFQTNIVHRVLLQEGILVGGSGGNSGEHGRGGGEHHDDERERGERCERGDGVDIIVGSGSCYRVLQACESGRGDGPGGAPTDPPLSQIYLKYWRLAGYLILFLFWSIFSYRERTARVSYEVLSADYIYDGIE